MKTVLIVDDDEPTQQLLATLMRRNGFRSVTASDGAKALESLNTTEFDLVILDVMMPGIDGQAVIEFMEREKATTPVIVCTASGPRVTDGINSEVVKAIVRKPFDIDDLSKLVASILGKST